MPHRWSRRQVVQGAGAVGLGLLAGCGRLPGLAQPRVPRIGVLSAWSSTAVSSPSGPWAAFRQALRDLGYVEGQNIAIEWRALEGDLERLAPLAVELARLPVDVIVTQGAPGVAASKQATSTIPIVIAEAADPVELGLVASLARPGGNVTGLSHIGRQLAGKRLELLKETAPGASLVGVL